MQSSTLIGTIGFVLLLVGVFGFIGFPLLINYKIAKSVALSPGSDMRKAWAKTPVSVDFKIYLFNITNVDKVQTGEKPIVQQIGPYFYDEWKQKVNLVDYRENDTVSFNMKNTWMFNKGQSGNLTGDELVTIPHVAVLSLVLSVEKVRPGSLTIVNRAIPPIYDDPKTAFITATVREILFDGLIINCTSAEFAPAAICKAIKQNSKGLQRVDDNIYKFSFFGVKNGTVEEGRFLVKRGVEKSGDVGRVVAFNGEPEMNVWAGPECNAIRGTDSTIFPPFIQQGEEIVSYAPDLCRSLGAKYQGPVVFKGIAGYHYTATLGDMSTTPEEKCYCPTPDSCLKKGAFDLSKCTGAPIILTLPHFFEADPSYLLNVSGLQPEKEKHQIYLDFEPITGTPLGARKRLQFNINIHAVKKITQMQALPTALVPIFWVEEGMDLDQQYIDILEGSLFRTVRIVGVVRWVLIALGFVMVAIALSLYYSKKNKLVEDKTKRPTSVQVEDITDKY